MFLTDKENACLIGDGNIVSKLINKSFLLHRWTLQQFATEIESKYVLAERGKCGKVHFDPTCIVNAYRFQSSTSR